MLSLFPITQKVKLVEVNFIRVACEFHQNIKYLSFLSLKFRPQRNACRGGNVGFGAPFTRFFLIARIAAPSVLVRSNLALSYFTGITLCAKTRQRTPCLSTSARTSSSFSTRRAMMATFAPARPGTARTGAPGRRTRRSSRRTCRSRQSSSSWVTPLGQKALQHVASVLYDHRPASRRRSIENVPEPALKKSGQAVIEGREVSAWSRASRRL